MFNTFVRTFSLLLLLIMFCGISYASEAKIRGVVEKIDGTTLYVATSKDSVKRLKVTEQTLSVSRATRQKFDLARLHIGSRINAIERNGKVQLLVVEEVPK
jgi:hypothetical protein